MKKKKKKSLKEKSESTPIRKEVKGIGLLLCSIFLFASLISFSRQDPGIFHTLSAHSEGIRNVAGIVGAYLSDIFIGVLGISAFLVPIILVIYSIESFAGKVINLVSVFSHLIMILCISSMLYLYFTRPFYIRGEFLPSGGILGRTISRFLCGYIGRFGTFSLLASLFLVSFMVGFGISMGRIFSCISIFFYSIFRSIREYLIKRREKKRKRQIRVRLSEMEKDKERRPTIKEPHVETLRASKQESFSFMNIRNGFQLPGLELLREPPKEKGLEFNRESLEKNARILEKKLMDFGVQGQVEEIQPGPVVTMYEFRPAPGVKISKVVGLSDDLALAMRAPGIRIVAPIPGKAAIGIEIPNSRRHMVYLRELLDSSAYKNNRFKLPLVLGKDITGAPFIVDLSKMPHLLVAGATGTGKSIFLNSIINGMIFKLSPDSVRFIIIDPKRIELSSYQDIPYLLHPVVTEPKIANKVLKWAVKEMERRYSKLSELGVRHIDSYNKKIEKDRIQPEADGDGRDLNPLPYLVIIIDELSDLMMVSSREVEESITRLAQMSRAAGIHLIMATQRPSVDVITGIIKANFPARISFQVSSKVDSRTILDTMGAECLLGEGDMLFHPPGGVGRLVRIHGAFISEEEVRRVTEFLRDQMKAKYDEEIIKEIEREGEEGEDQELLERDEKYEKAVELVIQTGQASISMLQRKLRVGYNRAARMIEAMEKEGIVGPSDGVRPREVYGRRSER